MRAQHASARPWPGAGAFWAVSAMYASEGQDVFPAANVTLSVSTSMTRNWRQTGADVERGGVILNAPDT